MNITDNTVSYLKDMGRYTFKEKEFNLVDSLILCQLSYFKLNKIVGGLEAEMPPIPVKAFRRHRNYDSLYGDTRYEEQYRAFYVALYNSIRFRDITMNYFMDIIDEELEMQFSAVTFFLEDRAYVAYRGTDETIVGWKEDFNMAFQSPIPAQAAALKYLKEVSRFYQDRILLGGHSKGGNAAIYAGMECGQEIQVRIEGIHCFDGPGFRDDVYQSQEYQAIDQKIMKLVPEGSFVGMLLQNRQDYKVVRSTGAGMLQHDPFTWTVKEGKFEYAKQLYKTSIYRDQTLNQWICSLESEELHTFVDALFQIIRGAEAATLIELSEEGHKSALAMLSTYKNLNKEIRRSMRKVIGLLFKNGGIRKK